jgi:hypothetical protein
VKPILDGMIGTIYEDDSQVVHVQSILLDIGEALDLTDLPTLVVAAIADSDEAVYVRVDRAKLLKELL